jgi:hypothetical protein
MGNAAAPRRRRLRLLGSLLLSASLGSLLVATASAETADKTPPTMPASLKVSGVTSTMVGVQWNKSTDNVAVKGYELSLNGVKQTSPTALNFGVFSNLHCSQTYAVGITAFDAAGNRSLPAKINATTSACAGEGTPPAPAPTPTPTPTPSPSPTPPPVPAPGPAPPPPPAPPASGSLHVSASGSDKNSCSQSAPCATFDRAYHAAKPGQFVLVAAGTYPAQFVKPDASKAGASAAVVFQPASGLVSVASVSVTGSHVEFRSMQMKWAVQPGADSVTLRNVVANGKVSITGASNVSVLGGQVYSPVPVSSDPVIASAGGKVPTNILIDGVSFHNWYDVGPGQLHHIECLQVGGAVNLTIQNSSFSNCATHDIFVRSWGNMNGSPYPLTNIVIQNNTMAATSGYYSMQLMDDLWTSSRTSFSVLGNNAAQQFVVRVSNGTAQVRYNKLPGMSAFFCQSYGQKQWYDYNTYTFGVPCGPHDLVLNPGTSATPPPSTSGSGSSSSTVSPVSSTAAKTSLSGATHS